MCWMLYNMCTTSFSYTIFIITCSKFQMPVTRVFSVEMTFKILESICTVATVAAFVDHNGLLNT